MKEHANLLAPGCKDFEEDVVLYYYGDGSEPEQRRVEGHITNCVRCRRLLDDLCRLLPHMAKPKELPTSFWDNYYRETVAKLAQHRAGKSWWSDLFNPTRTWLLPALGTATVIVLTVALVFDKVGWKLQDDLPQKEQIPQEILVDAAKLEFFQSLDFIESLRTLEGTGGTSTEAKTTRQL